MHMLNKWINYLSLIVLIVIGLLFYHHYLMFILLMFILILPIASYINMFFSFKKIKLAVSINKMSVGKNIPFDVWFCVKNNYHVPIEKIEINAVIYNRFYENEDKYSINISALPNKENKAKLSVSSLYCGIINVEITDYYVYDFLGLFRKHINANIKTQISIMPSKEEDYEIIKLSYKGSSKEDGVQNIKGEDVSQISEIRDYIPGDRLSDIHWKLSAKKDELQVKEYSLHVFEELILLIELFIDKNNPKIFDEIIEELFSLSNYLISNQKKFFVSWCGSDDSYEVYLREVNNTDDLIEVIKDLFYIKSVKYDGAVYDIYMSVRGEIKGTILYLSDGIEKSSKAIKIDTSSEKVVLVCI